MRPSIEELFCFIKDDFNHRVKTEKAFRTRFADLTRTIVVHVEELGTSWNFTMKDGMVGEFRQGEARGADITMSARDLETVFAIFSGAVRPTHAMAQRRIRVDASLPDLLLLKRLLDDERERIARFLQDFETSRGGGVPDPQLATPAVPPRKFKTPFFGPPDK